MTPSRLAGPLVALVPLWSGCAKGAAEPGEPQGGDPDAQVAIGDPVDAGDRPQPPDAMSSLMTLTQSTSTSILEANAVACPDSILGITTVENHYYRRFDLATEGAPGGFAVTRVSFGLELASAQQVELALHELEGGTFNTAALRELARAPVAVPEIGAGGAVIDVDLNAEAEAGSVLVVELHAPDNFGQLYIGTNTAGESAPTYLRAPDCDLTQPTPATSVTTGPMHWVLSVTGIAR